jgi:hypothetical protein
MPAKAGDNRNVWPFSGRASRKAFGDKTAKKIVDDVS